MSLRIIEAGEPVLAASKKQYPEEGPVEIAFAGRSNVGKSSLLNMLTGRKNLARVSGSPGKTRTINFYDVKAVISRDEEEVPVVFRIVDLPGYGYAKVSKKESESWGKMMEEFLTGRNSLKAVVQLIDSRHDPTAQDVQMYDFLKYYGLSGIAVATKSDKLKKSEVSKNMSAIRKKLGMKKGDALIPVSALKKSGMEELLDELACIME